MKRINFNQRPTPVARGSSRATCKISLNACGDWWWLCLYPLVSPTWLYSESVAFLCPLRSHYHAISSGVNHNATAREQLLPSPSLAGSQTWVSSTTRGQRLTFGGQPLLPHSMCRAQGWGHLRANLGFGVFWFIPPLLSKSIFGQSPI